MRVDDEDLSYVERYFLHPVFGRPVTLSERLGKIRKALSEVQDEMTEEREMLVIQQRMQEKRMAEARRRMDVHALRMCAGDYVHLRQKERRAARSAQRLSAFDGMIQDARASAVMGDAVVRLSDALSGATSADGRAQLMRAVSALAQSKQVMALMQETIEGELLGSSDDEEEDAEANAERDAFVNAQLREMNEALEHSLPALPAGRLQRAVECEAAPRAASVGELAREIRQFQGHG